MIVVVVQADLPPCDHLGMPRELPHGFIGSVIREPGFVRMDPDSRVHERVLFRELNSGIERGWAIAIADRDHPSHSGLASASDHLLAIGVELLAVEMCVRIYKHCLRGCLGTGAFARPPSEARLVLILYYLRRAPTGTSSRKLANTGFPPSSDAATIMPFDS